MKLLDLGLKSYEGVWTLQKELVEERINDRIEDSLILVEHHPVYTIGRNRDWSNLLLPMESLAKKGFSFYKVERGGDITYHGPGQLVGYPIFKIDKALAGVKEFVFKVEEALIRSLSQFGIKAYRHPKYTGVFTDSGKIASIGIAFKKWVSYHGFALNVNNDLDPFKYIIPCGLSSIPMTSMKLFLHREVNFEEFKEVVFLKFREVFESVG